MKKHYFITMVVCLFTLGTMAQPVITYNGNAPQIGDVYHLSVDTNYFNPGTAGGNQSWDFSDAIPILSSEITVMAPESTPFSDTFPEANIAFHIDASPGSPEQFIYRQINSSEMLYYGSVNDPGSTYEIISHYTDAQKQMQYPFSFSNTYTDSFFTSFSLTLIIGTRVTHHRGTVTATADAWGSVKTPAGTYGNALRVKQENTSIDSVFSNGELISTATTTSTYYAWYTATSHYPVAQIADYGEMGQRFGYASFGDGIKDNPLPTQVKIYPNPATDMVNLELPDGITGEVEIDLVNTSGQKLLQLKKTGNRQFSADVCRLSPGIYFIKINNNEGNKISVTFIKQ